MGGSKLFRPAFRSRVRPQPRSPRQSGKGLVSMHAPIRPEDRIPPVSRVIAEALVRRQGPSRIVTRATHLGLSPMLTRAVVVACAASALDSDGIVAKPRPAE
jgi:hypothetical protein